MAKPPSIERKIKNRGDETARQVAPAAANSISIKALINSSLTRKLDETSQFVALATVNRCKSLISATT